MHTTRKKIAIIGGGIAGLTVGYLLHREYDILLFEKSERIGGNAYTFTTPEGEEVDIAAAAFGRFSYKNVFKLFKKLNIETIPSFSIKPLQAGLGMSFYNLDTKNGLFLTPGLKALFSQKFEILRPDHMKSILDLARALKRAKKLLHKRALDGLTVEALSNLIPQLRGDARLMLFCCLCLISSMHCNAVLDAPASFFIEKINVYSDLLPPKALLSVNLTKNRTKRYIDALSAGFRNSITVDSKIKTVIRRNDLVVVLMEDGKELHFDKIVFACNADQALQLLQEPSPQEKKLLGAWKYTEGRIVVHSDHSFFPKKDLMNGYTFLYRNKEKFIETSVSGSLWVLPGLSKRNNLISTQHANFPIQKDSILFEKVFRTPIFDFNSCATINDLPSLNGLNNTYYCGSHIGFGLHEDAVTSAIEVAKLLGVAF